MVGFYAMALAAWQRLDERPAFVIVLGVMLAAASSMHYLAASLLPAFAIGELARTHIKQTLRPFAWIAFAAGIVPFIAYLPYLLHYKTIFSGTFWAKPTWSMIVRTYSAYLGAQIKQTVFVLTMLSAIIITLLHRKWVAGRRLPADVDVEFHDVILYASIVAYPAALFILMKMSSGAFTERYALAGLLGMVICTCYGLLLTSNKQVRVVVLAGLVLAHLSQIGAPLYRPVPGDLYDRLASRYGTWQDWIDVGAAYPSLPIVVGSPFTMLVGKIYAPESLQGRLVEITDPTMAFKRIGTASPELNNMILGQLAILKIEGFSDFLAKSPAFLLCAGGAFDWVSTAVSENGYKLRPLRSANQCNMLYAVEKQ